MKRNFRDSFTAETLADIMVTRLRQKAQIKGLMKSILLLLNRKYRKGKIRGHAILLTGRFTRKDRAAYEWSRIGKTSRSNRLDIIDYSNKRVALKFSSVSFKISIIRSIYKKKKKSVYSRL